MVFFGSIFFYFLSFWGLYASINSYSKSQVKADPKSHWKAFAELEQNKKYLYISYITSIENSFGCLILGFMGNS
jgi:hypothetical protein